MSSEKRKHIFFLMFKHSSLFYLKRENIQNIKIIKSEFPNLNGNDCAAGSFMCLFRQTPDVKGVK